MRKFNTIAAILGHCLITMLILHDQLAPLEHLNNLMKKDKGVKVLIFLTTHMPPEHIWYLKSCWPSAIRNSVLLQTSDILVYINHRGTSKSINTNDYEYKEEEEEEEYLQVLKSTFVDQNLKLVVRENRGYQEGAIDALSEAFEEGWFSDYDWVIRLNPDVIIRDETFLVNHILHKDADPDVTALLINCHNPDFPWRFWKKEVKIESITIIDKSINVQTDFFAIKPGAIQSDAFLNPILTNAERVFTYAIREDILNKGGHRWIPNTMPLDGYCRAGSGRPLEETPITHHHVPMTADYQCPITFSSS